MRLYLLLLIIFAAFSVGFAAADNTFTEVCPGIPVQTRTGDFEPGGIILTAFDKTGIWVYNINRDSRYPLPDTSPCNRQCRLSPDARWITYLDPATGSFGKMRLDGTQRTYLTNYAHDIEWWPDGALLIWTPGHQAYWQNEGDSVQNYLNVSSVMSVQPGGHWGVFIEQTGDTFSRYLLNLDTRDLQGIAGARLPLGEVVPYFDASSWSPDGNHFAYAAPVHYDETANINGAELFVVQPGTGKTQQLTNLNQIYGAVRINGGLRSDLSWSPDSTRIAFWVIELTGSDYEANTGSARIHVVDIRTGDVRAYCGYSTTEHTPDPPRLEWSPDGTSIAFGGNIPSDDKGYLLLSLNLENGVFTELSDGIFPVLGQADVLAWGLPPQ